MRKQKRKPTCFSRWSMSSNEVDRGTKRIFK